MKRISFISMLLSLSLLSGCADQINIEDISLTLLVGIDLDEENRLVFSSSSPVFNVEAKEKEEKTVVFADTLRESREKFDATVTALTSRGKLQVLLLGKRLLQHKDWFSLVDTMYRDGKNTVVSRIALVDGPVSEIVTFNPKDKPRLPIYLAKLIDTSEERNIGVLTTLQELHRQFMEKGVTPNLTELKKDGTIQVSGTALLDNSGKYKLKIKTDETKLMRLLQKEKGGVFTITIGLPDQPGKGIFHENMLSFTPLTISVKTKTDYKEDKFKFDMKVKLRIAMNERLFPYDVKYKAPQLEKEIQSELQQQFMQLIKKFQTAKIDPIGFGLYARAYEYPHWLKVQDRWGEVFSEAEVNVKTDVKIQSMGSIK
ncbi:Ger(x)C family spore germination protein [Paenibacillus spongiae]|uniref:Ger(X)C family spore germination protein n=1 Tax=Paenibacillus spongiae TaxID=2909671 RepID=A0ABY5S3A3_9BACL|nr:Ger(x)C family spore germination protein [Paenibacillus spongiae]UVI28371.1 Ger(x)C family spore germination protein [Paenibacillus spongiae]